MKSNRNKYKRIYLQGNKSQPRIQMQYRKELVKSPHDRKELGLIFDNELNEINNRVSLGDKPI